MEVMDTTPDSTPHTVRVKRKRDEAPLSALMMEDRKQMKKTKPNGYVFKLAGTFEQEPEIDANILLESEPSDTLSNRVFRLPKRKKREESVVSANNPNDQIAQSLTDMVNEYLGQSTTASASTAANEPSTASSGPTLPDTLIDTDAEVEDYVYDIYYREAVPDMQQFEQQQQGLNVGLIMVDSDDEFNEDDEDARPSDDEDSNAEDFYRNDYPEDEFEDESEDDSIDSNNEFRDRELPEELREGRAYMGNLKNQDDEDDYNTSGGESYNDHSPREFEAEEWPEDAAVEGGEDQDLDSYRDQIFDRFQRRLDEL